MLKIGEFSRICQVSMRALRHWDSMGLLKPAVTDAGSGYRYYSIQQVSDVNRILAFRTMGLSLERITDLMSEDLSLSDIRAMLLLKQAELQQQVQESTAMLAVVEARLRQIEHQGCLPEYEVALKSAEPQAFLAIREIVPTMDALIALLREAYPYARQKDNSNLWAVFHDEGYESDYIDVEVGFPVENTSEKPLSLSDKRYMTPRALPAVKLLAATVHRGEWWSLSQAYHQLGTWIDSNDYVICGPGREIFHHIDWEHHQKATVTELQFPIVKRN